MELIVITGYSGAGKSIAIHALEDIDFYCVDNLPPALIDDMVELCKNNNDVQKVAIVTDVRGASFFDGVTKSLKKLKESNVPMKILFIEANRDILVSRYKETRRKHPLLEASDNSIERAVEREHELMRPLRDMADFVIDTSLLTASQLRERTKSLFLNNISQGLNIHCMSFGFKHGFASEADLVFDVRCLPNPFYIEDLKYQTGLDEPVHNYVMSFDESKTLLSKLKDMIDFLIPLYQREGKSQLVIAFGCTGGKHRSVTFAEEMYAHLKASGKNATVSHRDINK